MISQPGPPRVVTRDSAGIELTPEQFDAVEDFEEGWDFELIGGLLVAMPACSMQEAVENEYLGYLLELYKERHFRGRSLDETLSESIVKFPDARRKLDRAIWVGLGRKPVEGIDVPTIGVEFRVAGHVQEEGRNAAFLSAGVKELWTFDRDAGELIVETAERRTVVDRRDEHESPLLPGFRLPVGRIFEEAREYGSDAD